MFQKIVAIVITSVLISAVLSYWYYTPVSERSSDTMYESVSGIFILYMIFVLPIILVSGLLTDWIVGKILKLFSVNSHIFVVQTILYVISGVTIAMFLILTLTKDDFDIPISLLIAGSSALLYFIVSCLIERTWRHPI